MWIAALLLASVCAADTLDDRRADLFAAVASYADPLDLRWDSTSTRVAWADLNGDGRDDALVTMTGADWCGSGGCTLLVFEAMDEIDAEEMGPFRPAAEISLVQGPVHIVRGRGLWSDLIVETGDQTRVLHFNGDTYPPSPRDGDTLRGPMPPGTTLFADGQ